MLASAKELGLAERPRPGSWSWPQDAPLGRPLARSTSHSMSRLLDLNVTPNRGG